MMLPCLIVHSLCYTPVLSGRPLVSTPATVRAHAPILFDRSPESLDGLITSILAEDAREKIIETTVAAWDFQDVQNCSDAWTKAIEVRVVAVQTAAIAEHERGGDTVEAQAELQKLVDMMVYMKLVVRRRLTPS